jgi:hypothetical protein
LHDGAAAKDNHDLIWAHGILGKEENAQARGRSHTPHEKTRFLWSNTARNRLLRWSCASSGDGLILMQKIGQNAIRRIVGR